MHDKFLLKNNIKIQTQKPKKGFREIIKQEDDILQNVFGSLPSNITISDGKPLFKKLNPWRDTGGKFHTCYSSKS